MDRSERITRFFDLVASHLGPDATVDVDKLNEALGLSSLQQAELLTSINAEFGLNLTPDDFATGGNWLSLLDPD